MISGWVGIVRYGYVMGRRLSTYGCCSGGDDEGCFVRHPTYTFACLGC